MLSVGVEPTRLWGRRILSPLRLPVPSQEQMWCSVFYGFSQTTDTTRERAGKENRTPRTTLEVLGITTIRYPRLT